MAFAASDGRVKAIRHDPPLGFAQVDPMRSNQQWNLNASLTAWTIASQPN
jgi:hypothetical protein